MGTDVAALIERDEASDSLRKYTARLCAILRRGPNRDASAIGTWSIGDVANHVTWGIENYTRWLQGGDASDLDSMTSMARWNVETVRRLPPADLPALADRIEAATDEFLLELKGKPPFSEIRWYAGNVVPMEVAVCMRLVEAGVHGFDIATAAKAKWVLDVDDARTMSYGLGYISPYFVDASKLRFSGTLHVHLRGGADLYYIVADNGLTVTASAQRSGWHLSVDPVSRVLVSTGRRNQWIAALSGKIVGWGRSPLLPFKLQAASFAG